MPIVTVNIKEGRTVEQKREMARRMTQVICETMKVEPAAVRSLRRPVDAGEAGGVTPRRGICEILRMEGRKM